MLNIWGLARTYWNELGFENNERSLVVNSCGYQKFITKNFEIKRHKGMVDFLIIYIVKGKGFYKFKKEILEIPEGNIVVYLPSQPQYYSYHFEDSTELYWVHFTGCDAYDYIRKIGLTKEQLQFVGMNNKCVELFNEIIHELQVKRPFYCEFASAHLLELISCIGRMLKDVKDRNNFAKDTDLKKVIQLMHSQYNQNYTVLDFAKESNLSLYRFIHKFKSYTGMTPVQYLTTIRIDVAKNLLSNSSLSISEVASLVGYENPLYFSRVFKKVAGIPPSSYKNNSVNGN